MRKTILALIAVAALSHAGDIPDSATPRTNAGLSYSAAHRLGADAYTSAQETERQALEKRMMRSWERSLIPLFASQSLDAASSYGYRELNPLLADPNGRFGIKATTVKFSVVGALVGAEYLLARKSPRAAHLFSRLNWSSSAVTCGLAAHNYMVR